MCVHVCVCHMTDCQRTWPQPPCWLAYPVTLAACCGSAGPGNEVETSSCSVHTTQQAANVCIRGGVIYCIARYFRDLKTSRIVSQFCLSRLIFCEFTSDGGYLRWLACVEKCWWVKFSRLVWNPQKYLAIRYYTTRTTRKQRVRYVQ